MKLNKNPLIMGVAMATCFGIGAVGTIPGSGAEVSPPAGSAFVPEAVQPANGNNFAQVPTPATPLIDPSLTIEQIEALRIAGEAKARADALNQANGLLTNLLDPTNGDPSGSTPDTPGVPSEATKQALDRLAKAIEPSAEGDIVGRELAALRESSSLIGGRYVWGGESPSEGGWDCSGLVHYAYNRAGIALPRETAHDYFLRMNPIRQRDAIPGDLIFYFDSQGHAYHVALYVGGDMQVEARNPRVGLVYSKIWSKNISFGTPRGTTNGHQPVVRVVTKKTVVIVEEPGSTETVTVTVTPTKTEEPTPTITETPTSGVPTLTLTPTSQPSEPPLITETPTSGVPTETVTLTPTPSSPPSEPPLITETPGPTITATVTPSAPPSSPAPTTPPSPPAPSVSPNDPTPSAPPSSPAPTTTTARPAQTTTTARPAQTTTTAPPPPAPEPSTTTTTTTSEPTVEVVETKTTAEVVEVVVSPTATSVPTATAPAYTAEDLRQDWPAVVANVKATSATVGTALADAKVTGLSGGVLKLAVSTPESFTVLDTEASQALLRKAILATADVTVTSVVVTGP